MKIIIYSLLVTLLLCSCSSVGSIDIETPDINLSIDIDSTTIVILPFVKHGSFLPSFSGSLMAEKLSDKLFLTNHFFVIETSQINETLRDLDIKKNTNIGFSQIQAIGSRLNANYIFVGRIMQYSKTKLINLDSEQKVDVSFRILSVETGDVVGIVNIKVEYDNLNIIDVIDLIAEKISSDMIEDD